MNMPAVQEYTKNAIVNDLQAKLGTELGIKRLSFQPFNTLALDSVYLYDQADRKILDVNRLSASLDLFALLNGKLVVSTIILNDFEIKLAKDSASAPLNIQYIIDAFPPGTREKESEVNLKLSTVHIEKGRFSYDIEDKHQKGAGFDANHISVSDLNAKLSIKSILSDSLNIQLKKLDLKEKSGFEISNLIARFITQGDKAFLKGFRLDLPESYLEFEKFELNMSQNSDSSKNTLNNIILDCHIAPSFIAPKDISAFSSEFQHFHDLLRLQGQIYGSINDIHATNLTLDFNHKMHLMLNANIKNLNNSETIYLDGKVNSFTVNQDGVRTLANNFSGNENRLPENIEALGNLKFKGGIKGYLDKLVADGQLDSEIGSFEAYLQFGLKVDGALKSYMNGNLKTKQFNLGKIALQEDFGNIALNIDFDMTRSKENKVKGTLEGVIESLEYKSYVYRNMVCDLNYDQNFIDGVLHIKTDNGYLGLNGFFNWENINKPELNLSMKANNVELDDLQIIDDFTNSNVSFSMNANLKGKTLDDIEGYINFDSLYIYRNDLLLHLDKMSISTTNADGFNNLKINSDILNLDIQGDYSFSSLIANANNTISNYLPTLIEKKKESKRNDELSFKLDIENTQVLSKIFGLPFTVIKPLNLSGRYNSIEDILHAELNTSQLIVQGKHILSSNLYVDNYSNNLSAKLNLSLLGKNNITNTIDIDIEARDDKLHTDISATSNDNHLVKDKLSIETLFSKNKEDKLQIDLDIFPAEFEFNKTVWQMNRSKLRIIDKDVAVNTLSINSKDKTQSIDIQGEYSRLSDTDMLVTKLKNIDLSYIFETLEIDALQFSGHTTGEIYLSNIQGKPYANTNLHVTDFGFNNTLLGDLVLYSELEKETNLILLDGIVANLESKETKVNGYINPLTEELSINFDADSINIGFLEHYAKSIFSHVSGRGSGQVHLHGDFSSVTVEGDAYIHNGKMEISFLNTEYTFSDSVHLSEDLIYFNNLRLLDKYNNTALASGKLSHDYFSNFVYFIDLSADNFLLYNTTEDENPLFFGSVFGSGKGSIEGDEQQLNIDISMRTRENTKVRMNFMEDAISEYAFIDYKGEPENGDKTIPDDIFALKAQAEEQEKGSEMKIGMNFYIDATPDASVEIVMDPVGGDLITGTGNGSIQFQWDTKHTPLLYGTYNIARGNYNFTFQRLMERRFDIADGSSVQFRGDPFEAILDVTALYKVTANLNDLDRGLVKSTGQSSIPVNCVLNLTGPLRTPLVGLDVSFPTADPEVARQVKSLMNTEDMISRQVTYLLLLNKFYTPDNLQSEYRTSDFAAVASATLSNQLTKIVSQIDSRWQVGTNIRTSDAEFTSTEVELILSSQLLNNRLLINGNFGYRDDPSVQENVAFIGDVDVEFLLNNSGTWRIKAYNHYNEKYYYNKSSTQTQGVGIMYKKEFDYFSELLFWRNRKKGGKKESHDEELDSENKYSFMEYK